MKKFILYAKIEKQKDNNFGFTWEKPFDIKNLPAKLEKYGRLKITFEKYIPGKSNKQLGYYFGGILPYMEKELYNDTGITKEDWHPVLKEKFGIKDEDKSGNIIIPRSLSKYSEKEMALFITKVINWVRDFFNVEIPPPKVIDEYI